MPWRAGEGRRPTLRGREMTQELMGYRRIDSGPPLTLDGTPRQARCHVAAKRIEDHNRRQRIDDCCGHHVVPGRLVAVEELGYRHSHRHVAGRREQHVLVEVLVPGEQQRKSPATVTRSMAFKALKRS